MSNEFVSISSDLHVHRKALLMFQAIIELHILWLTENGRHFTDDIFKRIFGIENVWIPIKISLKFVPKCPINNIPALV